MHEDESPRLNLGVLRSDMSLTLHTHHASRIWHGRAQNDNKPGIIGLNGYISIMGRMKRGAEQDDPFSDWWMLRIEEKIAETRAQLHLLREQTGHVFANIPSVLSLGENLNIQPVKLPLFVGAPLGFSAVYLLAEYDEIARKLLLAHHTALIDRGTLERWLYEGAHALRSLFALAQRYRYSGTSREDYKAQNAAWRAAVEKFGLPPLEVLTGAQRAGFAPPLRRAPKPSGQTEVDEAFDEEAAPISGVELVAAHEGEG